ncbi:outer membrane beta-barrel protein [bacterium]|nr:outer membrane beta-barrel protein [bacterium]
MNRNRVFCIVAVVLMLMASTTLAGPLGKTIKAGISYAQVTNDGDAGDSDHTLGLAAGVALSYDLVPGLSLQPEVLYVQQGGKYDVNVVDGGMVVGSGELTWDLDYIQVPVLAKIQLPVVGSLLPTIIAGPAFAFNVTSDYTVEGDGAEDSGEIEDLKSTDLSLIFGLAMKVGAGPAGVMVEARYNHGLTDLNDAEGGTAKINNRSFQVLAGFSF